ncbi:hypothetical protein MLD38_029810 [Melastoma candidum]|uniref:Uncharacterized protein n=3 Tax=Melastoma candidum TaxID=119954 RepID=A0ACB9N587_9MYRT|nr:hypothetical protein MLD38_029810 [Melastoma candidum]
MERELLEIFERAKKAADAAATAGGSPRDDGAEVSRCVDALKRLKGFPVSYDALVATQVGKRLRHLTKHPIESIKKLASEVLEIWKKIVIEETTQNKKTSSLDDKMSPKMERANSIKVEKGLKACANKVDGNFSAEKGNAEKVRNGDIKISGAASQSGHGKVHKNSVDRNTGVAEKAVKVERSSKEDKPASSIKQSSHKSIAPPKLTSMVKCNDPVRDKIRELLAEAFAKVVSEADEYFRDEVNACDPIRVAVTVESTMFEKMGRSNGNQKFKYRSIMFNLKDPNNPDFRRKVLLGQVKPDKLITMTPDEMASDQRQRENNQIKEKALFDCQRGGPPKATTDQFKCGRCGQRKTTYYQLQTRSADEPMTTFVTCVNCNNHWKFC